MWSSLRSTYTFGYNNIVTMNLLSKFDIVIVAKHNAVIGIICGLHPIPEKENDIKIVV